MKNKSPKGKGQARPTQSKKASATPRKSGPKFRVPKGFPNAGAATSADTYFMLYEPVIREREAAAAEAAERQAAAALAERQAAARDRRNARARQRRAERKAAALAEGKKAAELDPRNAVNAERRARMAGAEYAHEYRGWGTVAVTHLKKGEKYPFHLMLIIEGGEEMIKKMAKLANSPIIEMLDPENFDDEELEQAERQYKTVLTPWAGNWTPAEFDARHEKRIESLLKEYSDLGGVVTVGGYFINAALMEANRRRKEAEQAKRTK